MPPPPVCCCDSLCKQLDQVEQLCVASQNKEIPPGYILDGLSGALNAACEHPCVEARVHSFVIATCQTPKVARTLLHAFANSGTSPFQCGIILSAAHAFLKCDGVLLVVADGVLGSFDRVGYEVSELESFDRAWSLLVSLPDRVVRVGGSELPPHFASGAYETILCSAVASVLLVGALAQQHEKATASFRTIREENLDSLLRKLAGRGMTAALLTMLVSQAVSWLFGAVGDTQGCSDEDAPNLLLPSIGSGSQLALAPAQKKGRFPLRYLVSRVFRAAGIAEPAVLYTPTQLLIAVREGVCMALDSVARVAETPSSLGAAAKVLPKACSAFLIAAAAAAPHVRACAGWRRFAECVVFGSMLLAVARHGRRVPPCQQRVALMFGQRLYGAALPPPCGAASRTHTQK